MGVLDSYSMSYESFSDDMASAPGQIKADSVVQPADVTPEVDEHSDLLKRYLSNPLQSAKLNNITQRWADTATNEAERGRPAILFLHGFPESWFDWRHQLTAVHEAGYRGIAPDLRGYGGTDAPEDADEYDFATIAKDVVALLDHLQIQKAGVVGHDFGANFGWQLCKLAPDRCICYAALSVPYSPAPDKSPTDTQRGFFGDEKGDCCYLGCLISCCCCNDYYCSPMHCCKGPRFFYMLHQQLPIATVQYDAHKRDVLFSYFGLPSSQQGMECLWTGWQGEVPAGYNAPRVTDMSLYIDGEPVPLHDRVPLPSKLPSWLTQDEFNYLLGEFERKGFNGGINWYRAMAKTWEVTKHLEPDFKKPCTFITGEFDPVGYFLPGWEKEMRDHCPNIDDVHVIKGAGHWIQQEKKDEVNQKLLEFFQKHMGK